DDLYMACTGGTTGRPKAVMWRQGDIFVAGMGGADGIDEAALRARARAGAGTWFPTSPLMHVAAQWTAMLAANMGATVVLHDDEVGWIARTGHVPLGYLDDEAATESTFPMVDGVRVAIAGDRARYTADGRVLLLGRDSLVVNTGGEKVFVEEVEDALKRHSDV